MGLLQETEAATCLLLAWASASDIRTRTIPNACSVGGALVTFSVGLLFGTDRLELLVAAGLAAAFFGIAALWRPESLGAGDAKLAVLIAGSMGPAAIVALMLGLLLALAWCLLAWAARAARPLAGAAVPLAPFLAAGAVLTLALAG